jgi:hypothetical protein
MKNDAGSQATGNVARFLFLLQNPLISLTWHA